MREQLARWIAALTATVSVLLALTFAWVHNANGPASERPARIEAPAPVSPQAEAGREIYRAQRCGACHSIDGTGNPRYPLDGVGARLDPDTLRSWIVGAPEIAALLPVSAIRRKQQYRELPAEDLDALVAYLASMR